MKRLALTLALACACLGWTGATPAQSSPPPMPNLSDTQSADVQRQMSLYRSEVDGRVSRGEISADEAQRLLQWREWQLAQQAAGLAPPPGPAAADQPPPGPVVIQPAPVVVAPPIVRPYSYYYPPYYGPVYRPYYAPRPYYWGPSVCAGGFGRHFGGRFCF